MVVISNSNQRIIIQIANAKSCFRESVVIYVTIQVTTSKYNDNFR